VGSLPYWRGLGYLKGPVFLPNTRRQDRPNWPQCGALPGPGPARRPAQEPWRIALGNDPRQALSLPKSLRKAAESFVLAQLLGGYDLDPASYRMPQS